MLKWYGDIYSTAIPRDWAGAIVFKIKDELVVGFKFSKSLKEFAIKLGGYFDNVTGLWVIPVSDAREIGIAIKCFERDFPEASYIQVGCDGVSKKITASLQAWIEKRNAGVTPAKPETPATRVTNKLNEAKIPYVYQDTVNRILIREEIKISDEESVETPLSKGDIETLKSLGFKKDGALWELAV